MSPQQLKDEISQFRKNQIIKKNFIQVPSSLSGLEQDPKEIEEQLKEAPPLLFLEVNISEGRQAKLMVFENDEPEDIVEVFAELYDLGLAKKTKLMEIVKSQLAKILQNIGEALEEEDETSSYGEKHKKDE